ncbi:hypothetical protein ILUMI_02728 [Ignelater luminosus]|uniref:Uncharacterized protein n=1 Tax=Ignelater luminosus TaxID=2038154 RepID=A0A8K0DHN2_IGNLU|nr:hypothetical protein ILUMI_02728 [Ignelater luminosus]
MEKIIIVKHQLIRNIVLDEFLENPGIGVASNNSEIINEDEVSDDSIKDKDYHSEPGKTSNSNGDVLSELEVYRQTSEYCTVQNEKFSVPDKRGVAEGHNKMSEEQKTTMINRINRFPRYISNYCRATKNNQEFLPIGMTVTLMYKLYTEENPTHVSLSAYRKIFYKEFNLKTKIPKKDTCHKCGSYQAKIQNITFNKEVKQNVTSEHNRHLKEAELARKQMNSDLKIAA